MTGRKSTDFETALKLERLHGFRRRLAKQAADVQRRKELDMELAYLKAQRQVQRQAARARDWDNWRPL